MIVASKFSNGLDLGGYVLRPAMIGHEDSQKAISPGRERIAGYEITRNVPDAIWQRWEQGNKSSPILLNNLVFGTKDEDELNAFCWQNHSVRGWGKAGQDGSTF